MHEIRHKWTSSGSCKSLHKPNLPITAGTLASVIPPTFTSTLKAILNNDTMNYAWLHDFKIYNMCDTPLSLGRHKPIMYIIIEWLIIGQCADCYTSRNQLDTATLR